MQAPLSDHNSDHPQQSIAGYVIGAFFWLPWIAFCISMLLPATSRLLLSEAEPGQPIYGWQMYRLFELMTGLFILLAHPHILWQFPVIALANLMMTILPALQYVRLHGLLILLVLFMGGAAAALTVDDCFLKPRLIGFYVYVGSLCGACLACLAAFLIRGVRSEWFDDDED